VQRGVGDDGKAACFAFLIGEEVVITEFSEDTMHVVELVGCWMIMNAIG